MKYLVAVLLLTGCASQERKRSINYLLCTNQVLADSFYREDQKATAMLACRAVYHPGWTPR